MPRFFVDSDNIFEKTINITGDDVNHIRRVLRLKCGDTIIVSDGSGKDYSARIERIEPDVVAAEIIGLSDNNTEPPIEITLFQGIPKSDKMDFIIQKSVELGVKKIVPVITDRTVVKIDSKKDAENKLTRWQRVAAEAAKQCNRGIVPRIEMPVKFNEALKLAANTGLGIIPYEKENTTGLKAILKDCSFRHISVFIGPEGGFDEKEIQSAVTYDIKPLSLGPRILRTETAGIAVISIIMYELGDMGK